jgi:hypothetical protein
MSKQSTFPKGMKTSGKLFTKILTQNSKLRQRAITHSVRTLIRIHVAQGFVRGLVHCLMVQHMVAMAADQFKNSRIQ